MKNELTNEEVARFHDLVEAVRSDKIVLTRSVRKSDGVEIALICTFDLEGVHDDGDILTQIVPMAILFEDKDFPLYEDPTIDPEE